MRNAVTESSGFASAIGGKREMFTGFSAANAGVAPRTETHSTNQAGKRMVFMDPPWGTGQARCSDASKTVRSAHAQSLQRLRRRRKTRLHLERVAVGGDGRVAVAGPEQCLAQAVERVRRARERACVEAERLDAVRGRPARREPVAERVHV